MNRLIPRVGAYALTAAFCLITVGRLSAQTTVKPAVTKPADEETIELSPFVVTADENEGYSAKDTLAGTRVRTDLKDVASAISVVTKQFMQDTGAKNSADLLVYTTNTEVGGVGGNFSGNGGGLQFNEDGSLLRPNQNTRVRGLDSADNTRDYFLTEIPWDSYIVDRVDMQRGPNSILFGVGSPAGIINTSVNTASFKNKNIVENRIDNFGSLRNSIDFNKVLIPGELALRVAALDDRTLYRQTPAFNNDRRYFGSFRYTPKLFGEGTHTSLKANYESGKISANRPRTLPPVDAITPWFLTGKDAYGNANLNHFTYNQGVVAPGSAPFNTDNAANRAAYPAAALRNGVVGRQFWVDVVGYYGDINNSTPTAFRQPSTSGNNGISNTGVIDGGIGGLPSGSPKAIAAYSSYATVSGIPGGANYADRSLSDPSIFDFYNNLIDGNNKHEWSKWESSNVNFSQTFFHDRVGVEAAYDYQRYQDGQRVFLGNSDTYKLSIDLVNTFIDGTLNPNVGRPYVANSDEAANRSTAISRDGMRLTAYGEIRADDFLAKDSRMARILGRHVVTGLVSNDVKRTFNRNWATSAATPEFTQYMGTFNSLTGHFRSYNYMAYLGGGLGAWASPVNAHLSRVNTIIKAPKNALVRVFDSHWNKPTNPNDPGYVDPAAPYSYFPQNANLPGGPGIVTSSQAENPANYIGWRNLNVNFLNADSGDIDALTTNVGRLENKAISQAFTWQGYMFDGAVVPVFGWRRDRITNAASAGVPDALGIVNTNFNIDHSVAKYATGDSKSWGGVVHIPEKWTAMLPAHTKLSFFYNRSENFKADAPRGDVFGNVIDNPLGKTKEYGVVINTMDDKVSFKANWYETKVANATLPGSNPLGQNSYFLWAMPVWGTAFAAGNAQAIKGVDFGNNWSTNYAANDDANAPQYKLANGTVNPAWLAHPSTVAEIAAVEAWRKIPLPQSFFAAYGNEVAIMNVAAIAAGDWVKGDPLWNVKYDNQPVNGGQLAGFGSGPAFTVDTLSKGVELELAAQPTKNWNIAINASKTFATRASLAPTMIKLINDMTTWLATPAGDIRLWGGGASNNIRGNWKREILDPYAVFKSQEGSNAPEIAPWRFNTVTTYNFDHGKLKGSWIGGGYRWEQARVLGYQYSTSLKALDITKPWKGESDKHIDMWFGHTLKLTEKINWRIQANLRNIGESVRLVPVSINPDGTTAFSRIAEGLSWQLTNTFEF